jgi:hypothetical protein
MRTPTLAIAAFAAIALSTGGMLAVAQTTKPAESGTTSGKAKDRRDTNKDGVISAEEKSDARKRAEERFKAADKNRDGGLSREEARAAQGFGNVDKNFDAMDTNKDGKVTMEERRAWSQANRAKKKASGEKTSSGSARKSDGGLLPPR